MKKNEPKITIVAKKNGRKYAYRAVEHRWNPEKKSCETKLEYYGTVDDEGNIIPKKMKLVKAAVTEGECGALRHRHGPDGTLRHGCDEHIQGQG